jgi:hypothetical protein
MSTTGFPIQPPYEVFYIHSMMFNSESAIASAARLTTTFEKMSKGEPVDDTEDDILNSLQNIVMQGAALSRYFWPARKGHEARAQLLRDACGVTTGNPLENRDLRNAIEHFDENLDKYLANGVVGHFIPQYVGPELKRGPVPGHIFRAFYTDVGKFELMGKQYDVEPIADEIHRIHMRLEHCQNNGGRLVPMTAPAKPQPAPAPPPPAP